MIRDFEPNGDSVLRHASRKEGEAELVEELDRWKVRLANVTIDIWFAGPDTLKLCAKYGWIGYRGHSGVGESAIHKRFMWVKTLPTGQQKKVFKHYSEIQRKSLGRGKRLKPKFSKVNSNEAGTILFRIRDGRCGR